MIPHEVCATTSTMTRLPHGLTPHPVDRTSELRKKGYQGRRLGPIQMTTDTAVRVTRIIVQDRSNAAPSSDPSHASR
jgi:hypothetical protein